MTSHYIFFKNIHIHRANSLSSPITYGFPAVTGFLGAIHALQRTISQIEDFPLHIEEGVLIACSKCQPYTFKSHDYADASFIQTRNPLRKDGKTASIIEEGKVDLIVSLVIPVHSYKKEVSKSTCHELQALLMQSPIAGGSVQKIEDSDFVIKEDLDSLKTTLTPAYILCEAYQEMAEIISELQTGRYADDDQATGLPANPDASALDAIIACASFHAVPRPNIVDKQYDDQDSNHLSTAKQNWQYYNVKKGRSWLVPLPIGYQGISDLFPAHEVTNSRNPQYPSQYVESIYTFGKWIFPLSFQNNDLEKTFWRYQTPDQNTYLVSTFIGDSHE